MISELCREAYCSNWFASRKASSAAETIRRTISPHVFLWLRSDKPSQKDEAPG
jgi:hypothetical protein